MPDYSEFPTTPTAWQEQALRELTAPDAPLLAAGATAVPVPTSHRRRRPDLGALLPGLFFVFLALVGMSPVDIPLGIFEDGGVLWVVLIGAGVALLVGEVRRARRRR